MTDAELRVMRVLWDRGSATVGEVVDAIRGPRKPAYNTVLTMLRILEGKKQVMHAKVGRAFVYRPLVDRGAARRTALMQVLQRFFDNSPELLVLNLLEHDTLDEEELRRVRELVERSGGPRQES